MDLKAIEDSAMAAIGAVSCTAQDAIAASKFRSEVTPTVALALTARIAALEGALSDAVGDLEQTFRWNESWECSEDELLGHYRSVLEARALQTGEAGS